MSIGSKIKAWLSSPRVLRFFLAIARGILPAVHWKGTWMVFRDADVREVLDSDPRFGVTGNYAARMAATSGAFFLGMDDSPRFRREKEFAVRARQEAQQGEDVRVVLERAVGEALQRIRSGEEFDLVRDYAHRIPLTLVREWFGVPGPDEATLGRWLRIQFWDLFLNFDSGDAEVTRRAREAAAEMNAYLEQRIVERTAALAAGAAPESFLDRLVQLHRDAFADLEADAVRRNVAGVVIGAVDTQSKAFVLAVRELLRRPAVWAEATRAARAGDAEALTGFALEALRFDPHNPLVIRNARLDTTLRSSSSRPKRVAKGERVLAWTLAASFDPRAVSHAGRFDPRRPRESYLHFGDGLHRCFGESVVHVFLGEALRGLLAAGELRTKGPLAMEGPFPDSWRATLIPRSAGTS